MSPGGKIRSGNARNGGHTPVYLDDQFIGVIGIEMDYSFMTEQADNITLYDNGYAFVNS